MFDYYLFSKGGKASGKSGEYSGKAGRFSWMSASRDGDSFDGWGVRWEDAGGIDITILEKMTDAQKYAFNLANGIEPLPNFGD